MDSFVVSHFTVEELLSLKPGWVKRDIHTSEVKKISAKIHRMKAVRAIEVGVASGFSSAVIYNAMLMNTDTPKLYSFDISKKCYFDNGRGTGDAFYEIFGVPSGFFLNTGESSGRITLDKVPENVEFVFIDASHKAPWPTLDLLSFGRFVKPGAQFALHDIRMIFKKESWQNNNGPRDLYRSWIGRKHRFRSAPNLGFLVFDGGPDQILMSVAQSLSQDWDEKISPEIILDYIRIVEDYDGCLEAKKRVIGQLISRSDSWKYNKLS